MQVVVADSSPYLLVVKNIFKYNNDRYIIIYEEKDDDMSKKFYNISNDYLFKNVFYDENNLKLLLKEFYNIDCKKVIIKSENIFKENKMVKCGILDMLLEIDGVYYLLEMQNINRYDFTKRLLKYTSDIIHKYGLVKFDKNETVNYDELKQVKTLAIINYGVNDYDYFNKANLKLENNKIFTDNTEYNIVCPRKDKNKSPLSKMFTCNNLKEIEEFKNDEVYGKIYELIRKYNENKEEWMKMDDIAWAMINEGENYNGAYNCGHREGYNEGVIFGEKRGANIERKKRNIEIAKNLLKEVSDINFISRITGLSVNKIKTLKKEVIKSKI